MNKEETQQIYIKGYIDGMRGFDPDPDGMTINAESELFDVYARLRVFLEYQCNELTNNQRKIFDAILDKFDYILKTGEFNVR